MSVWGQAGDLNAGPELRINVADYLLEQKSAPATALLALDGQYTYGDLQTASTDIARYSISAVGARKGDRALLVSDNSFFWVAAYLGILRAGMVCIPLPPAISAEDLSYIISSTGPLIAFAQTKTALKNPTLSSLRLVVDVDAPAISKLPCAIPLANARAAPAGNGSFPNVQGSDLAALMFTSGSTGKPRGVMISHANIIANTSSIIEYLDLTSADRIMAVLPFHYCFGTSLLHTHLRVGGSIVIDHRFMFPEKVLQRMRQTECTGFAGVPSHYQILLRNSGIRTMNFPHLRYVQQAGGHLAPAFVRELRDALPTTKVFVMYGQTEATARLSYLPPEMFEQKPGSIGRGIPGVKLEVLNEAGEAVRRNGDVGEIVASGANIAAGYWNAPEDTAVSFREGKLHTGDLATVDDDGFIYIVGHSKDFIKCGGKRTSCRMIEEALLKCEELLEAAVIGIPDDVLGEAVKAFVVPRAKDGVGFHACIHDFCKQTLPPLLLPKQIVVMQSLPKNSAGKISKSALRQI